MNELLRFDMGPMSYINTNGKHDLYLGNINNAIEIYQAPQNKRTWSILNCACDPGLDDLARPEFTVLRLDHWDGTAYPWEKIKAGIDFITKALENNDSVLVCCQAGMSRSAGMMLAYLLSTGLPYNESIRKIRMARPIIQIHPKIDQSVRQYFNLAPRTAADLIGG